MVIIAGNLHHGKVTARQSRSRGSAEVVRTLGWTRKKKIRDSAKGGRLGMWADDGALANGVEKNDYKLNIISSN
jgi:hypothetical protein